MVAYLDRTNDLFAVLIPMLVLIDVGVLLLAVGLLRVRVVPAWAPWLAIAAMVADIGVQFGGVSATWPVTAIWGICTVASACGCSRCPRRNGHHWVRRPPPSRPTPGSQSPPDPAQDPHHRCAGRADPCAAGQSRACARSRVMTSGAGQLSTR
jgi:hypothetical protein